MPIDPTAVGRRSDPVTTGWTADDALLYAVAVGAGQDPVAELPLTTENSVDVTQRVLPTFAALVAQRVARPPIGEFDRAMLVHAEQRVSLPRPLPVVGTVRLVAEVESILDKGSGALVRTVVTASDPDHGGVVFRTRSAAFIRGEGGFGGPRGAGTARPAPDRDADVVVDQQTRPEQALLYRLTGDRNPLHSDPGFARRAGFDRPILHGMCTLGFSARALIGAACAGDPDRLTDLDCRFSAPVRPGDTLRTEVWTNGDDLAFRTSRTDGIVVIDRGSARRTTRGTRL